MKKLVLISAFCISLLANKLEIAPYLNSKDYSPDISQKDLSLVTGAKIRYEYDSQNIIFDFSRRYIKYRSSKKDTESDFTILYNFDDKTHLNIKAGVHIKKSTTNDANLTDIVGDGITLILGGSQHFYNTFNHKITVGSDFYATYYKEGIDDLNQLDKIFVYQISPFLKYQIENIYIKVQADYLKTPMYLRKDSGLLHTLLGFQFDKFFVEISGFYGKVKSAVFDGGFDVINTKNDYTQQLKTKLSYQFSKNLKASFHISQTDIKEKIIDAQEYKVGASFSYIFDIPSIVLGI